MNRNAFYSNLQSCCGIQKEKILASVMKVKKIYISRLLFYFYLPFVYS